MARTAAHGALKAAAILCTVSALAGCGVSTLANSFSGGMFGGSKTTETTQKVSEGNLLTAAQNSPNPQVDITAPGSECPSVAVSPGDGNITFMAKGGNDGLAVMHRGEITKTARECSPSINGGLNVKFGFAGRVLLGPQGKPGTVTLPVKVTVLDGARATVKSDLVKVPVSVTPDQTAGYFSVVREVVVPLPAGASAKSYRVIIGFDRRAPGAS
jgi:hypothetical protein